MALVTFMNVSHVYWWAYESNLILVTDLSISDIAIFHCILSFAGHFRQLDKAHSDPFSTEKDWRTLSEVN